MTEQQRVAINKADARTLQTLPRIGPKIAERILKRRSSGSDLHGKPDLISVGLTEAEAEVLMPLIDFTPHLQADTSMDEPEGSDSEAAARRQQSQGSKLLVAALVLAAITCASLACAIGVFRAIQAIDNGTFAWFIGAPLAAALIGMVIWLHFKLQLIRAKAGVNKVVFTAASVLGSAITFAGIGGGLQSLRFDREFPWVSFAEPDGDLIHLGIATLCVGMAYLLASSIEQAYLRFLSFLSVLGFAVWIAPSPTKPRSDSLRFAVLTATPGRAITGSQVLVHWDAPGAERVHIAGLGEWTDTRGSRRVKLPPNGQITVEALRQNISTKATLQVEVTSRDPKAKIAGKWLPQTHPFERVALISIRENRTAKQLSITGAALQPNADDWFSGLTSSSCALLPAEGALEIPLVFSCEQKPPADLQYQAMLVGAGDSIEATASLNSPNGIWTSRPPVKFSDAPAIGDVRIYPVSPTDVVVVFDVLTPSNYQGSLGASVSVDESDAFSYYPPTIYSDRRVEPVPVLVSLAPFQGTVARQTESFTIRLFDVMTKQVVATSEVPQQREWSLK